MQEWQTDAFRKSLVRKLEEAIRDSGVPHPRSAAEMENQVFTRSKHKEEYLSFVAKLILHVKQQGRNMQSGDNSQGMGNMGAGAVQQQSRMINSNTLHLQGRVQMQGMPVSQQQQIMQQQQQQMQIRARLQQQQQSQQMQNQQQLSQQQHQQQQLGPRMSQLQQALQQRPQGADMQGNMRQPGMNRQGIGSGGFTMIPGLQSSGPSSVSPLPYAQSPQGQIGNPSPGTTIPSPVGGQNRSNSLAPSPSSQVNTPMNPASQEEKEYQEKIKSLEKYIEPLRKMILGIGNEDNEKLGKMKKLLDIMSNPDKRMPLPTLQKCEEVLKRMLQQQVDSSDTDQSDSGIGGNADKNPLIESVIKLSMMGKGMNLNNSLSSTFLPPMEALMGPEITLPPLPRTPPPDEGENTIPNILQGEIARLDPRFKVLLDSSQPDHSSGSVDIVCHLDDRDLPAVPNLYVTIPHNYPDSPPQINLENPDYLSTPFLREISGALCSRMEKIPNQHTLSQLLSAWELSVRSACAPSPFKYQRSSVAQFLC